MRTSNAAVPYRVKFPSVDLSQLFLLGIAAIAAVAILGLLVMIVGMSLGEGMPGQSSSYTLDNYYTLFTDPYNYRVMLTTLGFAAVTICVSVPLGFIFAWLVERTDLPY
ncbi:MAG: hypothetical protein OEN50_11750, partial [Deltaproteobacteria bacterium]|nr:hypothetical protein [Deltaproteobacteria bacterium]